MLCGMTSDGTPPHGEQLRARRIEQGLSQDQLAAQSGVSQSHICRLESGERTTLRLDHANALAAALDTTAAELFPQADPS